MLEKTPITINFAEGLDTNTDPKQVRAGKFLSLVNSIFVNQNELTKRNGFGPLTSLPEQASSIVTLNDNLTALGTTLQAYSSSTKTWVGKGNFQPITLDVLPIGRSSLNQNQCDAVTAANGLVCTAYTELNNSTSTYKYSIQNSITGQYVVNPTAIPVSSGSVSGAPRVFLLGPYFIVAFTNTISAAAHLQYIAISTANPSIVTANADLATAYIPAASVAWDGIVVGDYLYFGYNSTTGGQSIKISYLSINLVVPAAVSFTASTDKAQIVSMCADTTGASPVIYCSFYDSGGTTGYVVAVDNSLNKRMSATQIISSGTVYNITSTAQNGVVTVAYEVSNQYSYDSSLPSNFLDSVSVTLPATVTTGTVGSTATFIRSVGLASKGCLINGVMYVLTEYASSLQSTYYLVDISGNVVSRFAYENGGANLVHTSGYLPNGLPQAQVIGETISVAYLYKDLIQSQNTLGLVQSIGLAGASNIYSQTGINLASLTFSTDALFSSEIAGTLNITGGMLWSYDGQTLCEQGFHVFPDNIECTWSATGGAIHAQPDGSTNTNAYYYQVLYQWTDANGNINYSAPSIPVAVTTTSNGTAGSITVNIPTLRLSYKTGVKIIIYRWSVAQQEYYQVTSITAPTLNNPAVDSIAYVDTLADASILGNSLIYTTGGVVEDTAGPAAVDVTLFDDRLWLILAEDRNSLAFSKQVIAGTPVEMSNLSSIYVAPSAGAQGSTGELECSFPMDDKLILFKKDAMYWLNGTGPDNTDSNSQYSQPIFITSSVGSDNKKSIVMTGNGLMFQSDKGIWMLPRGLGEPIYVGIPVRQFNQYRVTSAVCIPETTQVRFTLSNGVILMYDYFYNQWGTFVGMQPISSCLYQGLHTILDKYGNVLQETPGVYLDNNNPVLLGFVTGPISLGGIMGYQRLYEFIMLASYISPHKLLTQVSFNYGPFVEQALITPHNPTGVYGSDSLYGQTTPYGGPAAIEQWRAQVQNQKCQSFQISIQEQYDPSLGVVAGAGFTMSAITAWVGVKSARRPIKSANTVGLR
jgi:hypothetical protein